MSKLCLRVALATASLCAWIVVCFAPSALAAKPLGAYTTKGAWSFYSAPNLHPPKLRTDVKTVGRKLASGYFILSNFKDLGFSEPLVGQSGPMIYDNHLQPVWFNPVPVNNLATNLEVQTYNGQPALSWWQGVISPQGVTISGEDVVVGQNYKKLATLTGAGGWVISPHEMVISGTDAYVTAYKTIPMDLTAEGGSATGQLLDSAVQEYDLTNGQLLNTWDALQHIPLTQSKTTPSPANVPWDAYHVNSIQLLPGGSLLVALRNTWAVYMIDGIATGNIEWTLGGKASSFTFGPGAAFAWEHDAQLASNGTLTVFDDECCAFNGSAFAAPNGTARGLVLKLDTVAHTATLVAQYERAKGFATTFLGSMQLLGDGNALVGWGARPYFTEFSAAGKKLLEAVFPDPDDNYRALLASWVGKPFYPPSGAVRTVHGKTTIYASWDGATQVAKWRVLAGSSGKHLRAVATAGRNGFETAIGLSHTYKAYKLLALDRRGHVLGVSSVFPKSKARLPFY